jgi:hypothetical protein
MKKTINILLLLLSFPLFNFSQTYYPLPEENAYWTVIEFDNNGDYNDIIYKVEGDTIINNTNYKKVYRLDDYPTIYDTITTLHCFMRQNTDEKKIWFIRHYLGESTEKLGYDLSIEVGDTVSLPAFNFGNQYDSLFYLVDIYDIDISYLEGNMAGLRRVHVFGPVNSNCNPPINYCEGISQFGSTFPNLYNGWDPFHQPFTTCLNQDTSYIVLSYESECGFLAVDVESYDFLNNLKVFPNPASDLITVQLPHTFISPGILTIYNNFGEPVLRKEISVSNNSLVIDVSNFINGIYFISINSSSNAISSKLLVTH